MKLTKRERQTLRAACRFAIEYEEGWLEAVGYKADKHRRPTDENTLSAIRSTLGFIRRAKALIKRASLEA